MKKLSLLLVLLLGTQIICQAAVNLWVSGPTSVCPNSNARYDIGTDNTRTTSIGVLMSGQGRIIEYSDGKNLTTGVSLQKVSFSYDVDKNYQPRAYIIVHWGNFRGQVGNVHAIADTERYSFMDNSDFPLDVAIGSPDITGTTTYSASCDNDRNGFSIPEVVGATSYNWQNTLGWSPVTTFTNGGYAYALFTSNGSTATSGQVTVAVRNNYCPATNSTKTFAVTRAPGDHTVTGSSVAQPGYFYDYSAPDGSNYNWSVPAGWLIKEGQSTNHIQVQASSAYRSSGNITVTYTDVCGQNYTTGIAVANYDDGYENSATNTPKQEATDAALATKQIQAANLSLYPNPSVNELVVQSNGEEGQVLLYNSVGSLVRKINLQAGTTTNSINTADLPSGTYNVQLLERGKVALKRKFEVLH